MRLSMYATTAHSGFALGRPGSYLPSLLPWDPVMVALRTADVIIIDEVSMLTSALVWDILLRIREAGKCEDVTTMLRHKCVLMVGDLAQVGCESATPCNQLSSSKAHATPCKPMHLTNLHHIHLQQLRACIFALAVASSVHTQSERRTRVQPVPPTNRHQLLESSPGHGAHRGREAAW